MLAPQAQLGDGEQPINDHAVAVDAVIDELGTRALRIDDEQRRHLALRDAGRKLDVDVATVVEGAERSPRRVALDRVVEVELVEIDPGGDGHCGLRLLGLAPERDQLVLNMTITGFFKRGVKPDGVSWSAHPMTAEWGDWTWAYKTQAWLGTAVVKSLDRGKTWSPPIPVNVRPLKHGGCRLGCWQLPSGSLLMGLYGRIRGYEEEGEGESTRSALMRSDDGGENWEYFSTLAYDPASIIDYEEPSMLRLKDGRLVSFLRTHVNPSGDARNMVFVVSDDDGFTWSPPKWTNIWGYPPETIPLLDGRYLMIYGYRRPPYGTRGIISEDGVTWDVKNEFVIRDGGVPGKSATERPGSSRMSPASGRYGGGTIDWNNPGVYQHIGYPTVVQMPDGTIVAAYHEWSEDERPLQYCRSTRFRLPY